MEAREAPAPSSAGLGGGQSGGGDSVVTVYKGDYVGRSSM